MNKGKFKYIFIILISLLITSCSTPFNLDQKVTIIVPDQYNSIQEAIENSHDGDTILIKKGIYEGNIKLSKAVSLIGESPEETIILPSEENPDNGIEITFSQYSDGFFSGIRNTDYVRISSLQIRNFKTGISCSYNDIKSIDNCIIVNRDIFGSTLHLQGTHTPIYNCTLIGRMVLVSCSSIIENNIISYNSSKESYFPDNDAIYISDSPNVLLKDNIIWGTCNISDNLENIFADPEFINIQKLQFESIYSADSKGALIEGKFVEKKLDLLGPEIHISNNIKTDDLNIISKKDLVLEIKVYDQSPITNIKIETEAIDCLNEFKFERTKYLKEIKRTLIMQSGYNNINISSEDIFGNYSSKQLTFQLGTDTIPRSSWNGSSNIQEPIQKYKQKIGLAIGIQNYPYGLNTIKYAENDAISINNLLNKNGYKTMPTLLNPTLVQLQESLVRLSKITEEFDKVVIYISGHGSNESTLFSNSSGLILPVDVDINNLSITSFPMENFRDFITNLKAKTVIIILDMCFSSGGKGYGNTSKGANNNYITGVLNDTGQGKILLASSGDQELSFEDDKLKHGVFTYFLLEAVDKGLISIDAIYNDIYSSIQNSNRWSQRPRKIFISDDIEGYHTLF